MPVQMVSAWLRRSRGRRGSGQARRSFWLRDPAADRGLPVLGVPIFGSIRGRLVTPGISSRYDARGVGQPGGRTSALESRVRRRRNRRCHVAPETLGRRRAPDRVARVWGCRPDRAFGRRACEEREGRRPGRRARWPRPRNHARTAAATACGPADPRGASRAKIAAADPQVVDAVTTGKDWENCRECAPAGGLHSGSELAAVRPRRDAVRR